MLKISVIIPTYNRLARLKQVLSAFSEQDYPLNQFEVVVVSDGSRKINFYALPHPKVPV